MNAILKAAYDSSPPNICTFWAGNRRQRPPNTPRK